MLNTWEVYIIPWEVHCRLQHRAFHIVYLACLSINTPTKKVFITPELLPNRRKNNNELLFSWRLGHILLEYRNASEDTEKKFFSLCNKQHICNFWNKIRVCLTSPNLHSLNQVLRSTFNTYFSHKERKLILTKKSWHW